jgi:hypothetical protein
MMRGIYLGQDALLYLSPIENAGDKRDFEKCQQAVFAGLPFENYDR